MSTFVLVHGAWHGGWCWRDVARLLRAAGHEVFTPSLPGMGEHWQQINRQISLDTHVDAIIELIRLERLNQVVLVGHSYGGIIITGVADRLHDTDTLARLVYLDAVVPEHGRAWGMAHTPEVQASRHAAAAAAGGIFLPVPDAALFGIDDLDQRAWVQASMRPHPYGTYLSPIALPNQAAVKLPRLYVDCVKPFYGDFNGLKPKLKADKSWRYVELQTGHDCMVSAPQATAELLMIA